MKLLTIIEKDKFVEFTNRFINLGQQMVPFLSELQSVPILHLNNVFTCRKNNNLECRISLELIP